MRPIFPMKYLNITQGHRGGTHKAGFPIDIAGKDTGIDDVFAPFDGMIKKMYEPNKAHLGHTVWLESLAPVTYADGTVDFATIMLTHDNAVTDLRVGQIVKQGQVFYQEGTAGFATGNHVHLEVARGKMAGIGWQQVNGSWIITNPYEPHKMFFLSDTIIINGFGYPWKELETEMKIGSGDNWFYRFNRLHHQLVRNGDMDRKVFNNIVGGDAWSVVESWSDHPEADKLLQYQLLGELATKDSWQRQIADRTLERDNANTEIIKLQAALVEKPKEVIVTVIKEVPVEIIKEIRMPVEIDGLSVGELLSAIWAKLFKIK